MPCEPCTSSPERGEDSLPISFWDISQSAPLNGTPTPAESSENEPQTDGSPACTCMRETYSCLIHPSGLAEWTASMRDSLARILALQDPGQALKASIAVCGVRSSALLAWFDPATSSWKTRQLSLVEDWAPFSETWPRSGTMRNGQCWELPMLVPHTSASDGGALHGVTTPTVNDSKNRTLPPSLRWRGNLAGWLLRNGTVPTPTVCGNYNRVGASATSGNGLATVAGGCLNPAWVEWLMAWPMGWTALPASATDKSPCVQQPLGESSEDRDAP